MSKDDSLRDLIDDVLMSADADETLDGLRDRIAAAVRSFMGSTEVVNRAARGIAASKRGIDQQDGVVDMVVSSYLGQARDALSAAIGEDIGGGRG